MNLKNNFSLSTLKRYFDFLKVKQSSSATLQRKISSLSSFADFLTKRGLIDSQDYSQLNLIVGSVKSKRKHFDYPHFLNRYFVLGSLIALFLGLAYSLYQQSVLKARQQLAYSTAAQPVRPGRIMSFQGRLTDSVGNPITSSTAINFKFFNSSIGGTQLYDSAIGNSQVVVPDSNGIFNVVIGKSHGSEIPQNVFSENPEVWLQITTGNEVMEPRQQIATVAYALNSETLQGLPPSSTGEKNTVVILDNQGNLNLGESSPAIISQSGTFSLEGQSILIKADDGGGGGGIKLLTEGTAPATGGFVDFSNPNISSGNLLNSQITNTNRGYNFISFQNYNIGTSQLSTRFSVDANGNGIFSNNLSVGSTLTTNTLKATQAQDTNLVTNLNADLLDGYHANNLPYDNYRYWTAAAGGNTSNIGSTSTLNFVGGHGVGVTLSGNTLTFTNTSIGTTYAAGIALSLTPTNVFNLRYNPTLAIDTNNQVGLNLDNSNTWTVVQNFNNNFTVGSTAVITNLNADLLDGLDSTYFVNIGQTGALPYVNDATNTTLTRSGSGPYTLGLNLTNANTWTGHQTFSRAYQSSDGVPTSNLGNPSITEMALFETQFNNKTEFYDINNIFIERSTDGVNWTDAGATNDQKRRLVGGDANSSLIIPNGTPYFRIRFRSTSYVYLNALYSYWSSKGHSSQVQIYKKHDNGPYTQHTSSTNTVSAYPGHLYLPFATIPFHPSGALGTVFNEVSVVFIPNWNSSYPDRDISIYKLQLWGGYPAGKRTLYTTDEFQNVTFPANITTSKNLTIGGTLTTNTLKATQAQDTNLVTNLNADLLDGYHANNLPYDNYRYWTAAAGGNTSNIGSTSTLNFVSGGGLSIGLSGDTLTFTSTGIGTTYNAGTALFLAPGNTFNVLYDTSLAVNSSNQLGLNLDNSNTWTVVQNFNNNFTVGSTAVVTNLNADFLDGLHANQFLQIGGTGYLASATNGLQLIGTNSVGLGGTLTQTTLIDQNNFDLSLLNGKLGLGTSSPSQQLDMTGSINLSNTTNTNQNGVIYKDGVPFLHNFRNTNTDGNNLFLGENAGNFTMGGNSFEGIFNIGIGSSSLSSNTTGNSNTALGNTSLFSNTTGGGNTALGNTSLYFNTTGNYNIALGFYSLYTNTTGNYNIALGNEAGAYLANSYINNTSPDYSIYIGADTKSLVDNSQNEIVIGYNAIGNGSNSVTLGNDSIIKTILKGNVGLGTTAPAYKLDVIGNGRFTTNLSVGQTLTTETLKATQAQDTNLVTNLNADFLDGLHANQFLQIGGTGYLASATNGLQLIGTNSVGLGGTLSQNTTINTDSNYLSFVGVGGTQALHISSDGKIGIGTANPDQKLHISGSIFQTNSLINSGRGGFYINGIKNNTKMFSAEPYEIGNIPIVAVSGSAPDSKPIPITSLGSWGSASILGASSSLGGNRIAVGVYGYSRIYNGAVNNPTIGVYSLGEANPSISNYQGNLYGAYNKASSVGATSSTGGHIYGTYNTSLGAGGNTTYAGYFTATGGAKNFGIYSANGINYFKDNVGLGTTSPSQQLDMTGSINLSNTTNTNQNGVIYKNGVPFLHNFRNTNTDGNNLFLGENAGNFTMGVGASYNYESSNNIGIGSYALSSNTTGYQNTALGNYSLYSNTTGSDNTALGHASLQSNTTGSSNTALGHASLQFNTTSWGNTALGNFSLQSNTTGWGNTALGNLSFLFNTDGYYNIAIGNQAGNYLTDGSTGNTSPDYSIYIGANTTSLVDNSQNEIVIGYNATGNGSNSVTLGADTINKTILKGNVGLGTTAPSKKLDIVGDINLTGTIFANGTAGTNGQVLASTGTGLQWGNAAALTNPTNGLQLINTDSIGLGGTLTQNTIINNPNHSLSIIGQSNTVGLHVSNIGTVAIGTSTPEGIFHIAGRGVANQNFRFDWASNDANYKPTLFTVRARDNSGVNSPVINGDSLFMHEISGIAGSGIPYSAARWGGGVDGTVAATSVPGYLYFSTTTEGNTGPTERMRITSTGNIGIGTTLPTSMLDVTISNGWDGISLHSNTGNGIAYLAGDSSHNGLLQLYPNSSTYTVKITSSGNSFFNGGNVGIGTSSPISLLNLRGFTGGTAGSAIADYTKNLVIGGTYNSFYNSGNAVLLHLADYSNDAGDNVYPIYVESENNNVDFYIKAGQSSGTGTAYFGGNVGIGHTTPTYKLQVAGNAANTTGVWTNYSDSRLKNSIVSLDLSDSLDKITHLNPVAFNWNDPVKNAEFGRVRGFIAQEMEAVIPEWVITDPSGYKAIQPIGIDAMLVASIKELNTKIEGLDITADGAVVVNYNVSDEVLATLGYNGTKNELENGSYSLTDNLGHVVNRVGQFGRLAVNKLTASLISSKSVITDNLAAKHVASETIVTGNLVSTQIGTTELTALKIGASEASFSTLYADQIINPEGNISDVMSNKISSLRDEIKSFIASASAAQATPSAIAIASESWDTSVATDSAQLTLDNLTLTGDLVIGAQLTVTGQTLLKTAAISDMLTVGQIALKDNILETTADTLYIQPSGLGAVNILNGRLVVNSDGNININANVTVSGSLVADLLKASEIETQTLTTEKLNIGIATTSPEASPSSDNNATAGFITLATGQTEVTINNSRLTANSMVYLTPNGSTQNQVPYIKNKTEDNFTIAIDSPLDHDIDINWWLIN